MLERVSDATNAICSAKDGENLFVTLQAVANSFAFDGFLLFCHKKSKIEMILNATLSNYNKSFFLYYERFAWTECDFILEKLLDSASPVVWDTESVRYEDIRKQSYVDFLRANGLRMGVLVPLAHRLGTRSGFALSRSSSEPLPCGIAHAASIIANAALMRAEILGLCPDITPEPTMAAQKLSPL